MRDREAVAVGAAEPELAGAVQDLDLAQVGGPPFGQIAGAVGAVVVDDEHVGVGHRRARTASRKASTFSASS